MLHQSRCGKLGTLCMLIVLDFSYFIMQKICIAVHIRYIEVFSKFTALSWFRKKKIINTNHNVLQKLSSEKFLDYQNCH